MSKWFNGRFRAGLVRIAGTNRGGPRGGSARAALLAAVAAFALAGCDQIRGLIDRGSDVVAARSPAAITKTSSTAAVIEPGRGRTLWQAGNADAQDVTGTVRISVRDTRPGSGRPLALAFNKGVVVTLALHTIVPAETASGAGDATFAGLLGADADTNVFIYAVTEEQLSQSARGRGLCGGNATTHLAVAEFSDSEGEPALRVVSFHGAAAPGSLEGDAGFCRLLSYVAGS